LTVEAGEPLVPDGAVTFGAVTLGVVTVGVVALGAVTFGVVTLGVVTFGVVTVGVLTLGVETFGVVTVGVVTEGALTLGTVTVVGAVRVVEGTVVDGTLSPMAGALTQTVAAKQTNVKVAAIRLPWTIPASVYLDRTQGKPGRSEIALRSRGDYRASTATVSGCVDRSEVRSLRANPGAAPAVHGKCVAEPVLQHVGEGLLGGKRIGQPANEHHSAGDELVLLVGCEVGRDLVDRIAHVRLDVRDITLRIRLLKHSWHEVQPSSTVGRNPPPLSHDRDLTKRQTLRRNGKCPAGQRQQVLA